MAELEDRTVLFVIPQARFKDEEIDIPKRFLERKKCKTKIATPAKKPSFGQGGMRAVPDLTLAEVDVNAFDAIVFVGGMGCKDLWDDKDAHRIARDAVTADKIVAASSMAPIILGRAGVLKDREATVYFSETRLLQQTGAKYMAATIVVDGKIITCKGTEAMEKYSLGLIKFLTDLAEQKASG
jgi:protease I